MAHDKILVGVNQRIDHDVKIGYKPERIAKSEHLVIGNNPVIRSGTVIYSGSSIGDNLQTGHNVIIREDNIIGSAFKIWSNSIIDYGCKIGNNVKIHSNCYIAQYTVIEDNVFLAPGVTIANDMYPGFTESLSNMQGPLIRRNAQIGVNSTILPYVEVGEASIIGAGSVVVCNVPDRVIVVGNPARIIKKVSEIDLQKLSKLKRKF